MIEIIEKKECWDRFLQCFDELDVYHTFDYHEIVKGDGKPLLIKFTDEEFYIGLPLIIRRIPTTSFYDATSVYGYSGPLCKNISAEFNNKLFRKELCEYFNNNNIISVFSRLNPFIKYQHKVLENIGQIKKKGAIVNINLKKSIDLQRTGFRKRLKGQLNKSRRHCYVKTATSEEDLKDFLLIYHENMDRVNAKPMYYFDENYLRALLSSKSFKTEILLAKRKDSEKTIGASMFIYKNSTIHYHLSGTLEESLFLMPAKLLIDEMRIKATKLGLSSFNLGGGLGANCDSLLNFKSSFSKDYKDFHLWKFIVDKKKYRELTIKFGNEESKNYFPAYRLHESLSDYEASFYVKKILNHSNITV